MPLVMGTRFRSGILFAADPFFFDNDGATPTKGTDFDRFMVSEQFRCLMTGVGSRWVLKKAGEWIETQDGAITGFLPDLARKWCGLNREWKEGRHRKIAETEDRALRQLFDSLFILATSGNLSTINIGDGDGKLYSTSTFVFSGSGSDLVRHFIIRTQKKFSPSDTLEKCIELTWQYYRVASADLFVTGFPSIVVVDERGIRNLSKCCSGIWNRIESNYFTDLKLMINESEHLYILSTSNTRSVSPSNKEEEMPDDYYLEHKLDFQTGKLESKRRYDWWKQPSKRTGFWEDGKWRDETSQSLQATKSFICDKHLES